MNQQRSAFSVQRSAFGVQRSSLPGFLLLLAAVVALWAAFSGCGKSERALSTGTVLPSAALPGTFHGDATYAVVRSDALLALYDNFAGVLSNQGLVKWDDRYDCNHFAALYCAISQAKFSAAAWHSETKAQNLALAEVWYRPDRGGTHAIVAAYTEVGLTYLEPQTGRIITLSPAERASVFLCKW